MVEQITFLEDIKPQKSNDWKWHMSTDYPPKNGLKVFSCFACGGGSTMGYKLAGCDVIGDCEIDKRMNDVYIANHHPKYNYLMDIRDFNTLNDLPQELYDLDILDGSPPCSTFSMVGNREESWGKKKKFREGQVEQILDELLFVFIETVKKLRPKVVIMENVEGLLFGNAWKYVQKIYETFNQIGYKVKHWLLKGETMGVPQTRHRVFFVATRLNFDLDKVNMNFNYAPITYGEIKEGTGPVNKESLWYSLLSKALPQDKCLSDIRIRNNLSATHFSEILCWHDKILPTITANHARYDARFITEEIAVLLKKINIKTVHFAFDFMKNEKQIIEGLNIYSNICGTQNNRATVYILTNYNTTIEEDLYRVKMVEKCGFAPDIRIYRKNTAPQILRDLQRWANNKFIYQSTDFLNYIPRKDSKNIKELYFNGDKII